VRAPVGAAGRQPVRRRGHQAGLDVGPVEQAVSGGRQTVALRELRTVRPGMGRCAHPDTLEANSDSEPTLGPPGDGRSPGWSRCLRTVAHAAVTSCCRRDGTIEDPLSARRAWIMQQLLRHPEGSSPLGPDSWVARTTTRRRETASVMPKSLRSSRSCRRWSRKLHGYLLDRRHRTPKTIWPDRIAHGP
jgi:hypothetical protein